MKSIINWIKSIFSCSTKKEKKQVDYDDYSKNNGKTVIIVPVAHRIEPATDECLRQLEKRGYTVWRKYGFSAIDQGRCALAQEALDAGFDAIFWIDSDIAFWEYDVDNLINSGYDFITAPYTVKGWPSLTTEFKEDLSHINMGEHGRIYEVNYAATGFMYTHRRVYEEIVKHYNMSKVKIWGGQYNVYPVFFPHIGEENNYLGEDFAFCHRARTAGIKIYSDTRVRLSHIGNFSYSFSFLSNPHREEPKSIVYTKPNVSRYS